MSCRTSDCGARLRLKTLFAGLCSFASARSLAHFPMDSPTRLILSNLPPSLSNALLRGHLARCPPAPPRLTDCKILLKPDGTSRRIAFLGFNHTDDARRVLDWVAGTWIQGTHGGARINADWAKDVSVLPISQREARPLTSPMLSPQTGARCSQAKEASQAVRRSRCCPRLSPRSRRQRRAGSLRRVHGRHGSQAQPRGGREPRSGSLELTSINLRSCSGTRPSRFRPRRDQSRGVHRTASGGARRRGRGRQLDGSRVHDEADEALS